MTGFPRGGRAILTLGAALATCTLRRNVRRNIWCGVRRGGNQLLGRSCRRAGSTHPAQGARCQIRAGEGDQDGAAGRRHAGPDLAAGKIQLLHQAAAAGRRCRLRGLRPGPVRHRAAARGESGRARRADGAHAGGAHLRRGSRHVEELGARRAMVRARRRARRSRSHAGLWPDAGRRPGHRPGSRGRGPLFRGGGGQEASARQLQSRAAVPEGRRQAGKSASRPDAHALCRRSPASWPRSTTSAPCTPPARAPTPTRSRRRNGSARPPRRATRKRRSTTR